MLAAAAAAIAAILAIVIHGGGHLLLAHLLGIRFSRVCRTATGFRLLTGEQGFPSYLCEFFVTLGGPLFNVVSALFVRALFPPALSGTLLASVCDVFVPLSFYLALLNVLPLRGFDGGGLLVCMLCVHHPPIPSLLPDTAERVLSVCSALTLFLLWLVSVYLLLLCGSALSLYVFCAQLFRATLPSEDVV